MASCAIFFCEFAFSVQNVTFLLSKMKADTPDLNNNKNNQADKTVAWFDFRDCQPELDKFNISNSWHIYIDNFLLSLKT